MLSLRNPRMSASAWLRVSKRGVEVGGAVGEDLRHRGDVAGECHDLVVAVGQGIDQGVQVLDRSKQIGARVAESACGLGQFAHRLTK